jgi:hypothetical protein
MKEMITPIFVATPAYKPTDEFAVSVFSFLSEASKKYDITYHSVWGKELVVAQNIIADRFLQSHSEWLLFLEDDHSGHTVAMLDDLMQSGHRLVGIKYYSRWYPYTLTALNSNYDMHIFSKGEYEEVALMGFGMTLIHRSVFDVLDKPYFRLNDKTNGITTHATDKNFCDRLIEKGVVPVVCNKHCLTHRGINDTNVIDKMMAFPYRSYRADIIAQHRERKERSLCQN